jgi:hypothetical protein
MEFTGFQAEQFANYEEPRSRSNVYSRQRLEVKEALLASSGKLLEQLSEAGLALEVLASDHHPSLWNRKVVDKQFIFFSRGEEERGVLERLVDNDRSLAATLMDPTPYFKYAFLSLGASGQGFETAVKLHWRAWVDRDNFLSRLEDRQERESFLELLTGLPEEYVFGLEDGPVHPVAEIDDVMLDELVAGFRKNEGLLSCGLVVEPEKAEGLGPDLMEVASAAFLLLVPVYDVLSWSEDSDRISLRDREEAIDEARRIVAERHRKEREAFESRQRERKQEQAERFEQERAEKIDHQLYREQVRRVARAAARKAAEQEAREAEDVSRGTAEREAPPPRAPERLRPRPPRERSRDEEAGSFEVKPGTRVEIAAGVLSGKWGVVQEVDNRGQAKVVLGSLVTRVAVEDLREPRRRRR